MKRLVKIFKWLLFITLFLLIGLSALFYFKRDEIIAMVVNEASKQLTAPVEVGEVDISFSKFPAAAIHLNEVFTAGNPQVKGDTLLYAQSVYLQFDIWHVITGNISIDRISIENGSLNIIRNHQNQYNYQIWKPSDEPSDESLFAVKRLLLLNMRSSFLDEPNEVFVKGHLTLADAEGEFSEELAISTQLVANVQQIRFEHENYFEEKVAVEGNFTSQYLNDALILKSELLSVNGNTQLAFEYNYQNATSKLLAWAADQDIDNFWQFALQHGYVDSSNYKLEGKLNAELNLINSPDENRLEVSFNTKKLNAEFPDYLSLQRLKLDGIYSLINGKSRLEINELALNEGEDFLSLKAQIDNLDHPQINGALKANLPVEDWITLLPLNILQNGAGRAKMDFSFAGKFADLKNITTRELSATRLNGDLTFERGGFDFKNSGRNVQKVNGELTVNDDNLIIKRLFFSSGESDIYLQGRFENVLNFMFFDEEDLVVKTMVKSQEIVLDDFIRDEQSEGETYKLDIINNLELRLQLEIDRLSFGNFRARNLKGNLQVSAGEIVGSDLSMQADGGHYQGNFLVSPQRDSTYLLRAFLEADDIQMNSVFKSFKDFNQEAITAQNLQGQASIQANIGAKMSKALVINPSTIDLVAAVEIINGHLKNYEPLKALSRFAELQELEDVQFSKLSNTITIHNSEINIPEMAINSSVLDLELSGTHDFDNNIDYIISLKLSDILFSKRKGENKGGEFDEHLAVADRGDDHIIPVAITGTLDNPKISISRKGFKESIGDDLKKQGQQLKDLFKKDKAAEKQKGNGIIFEWDEG